MRQPPNRPARWAAAHPVAGAVLIGLAWGVGTAVFVIGQPQQFVTVMLIGLVFFGPSMVWTIRRGVRKWDTSKLSQPHPESN